MSSKRNDNTFNTKTRKFLSLASFVLLFACTALAQSKTVTLHFVDSVMINDAQIRLGDIARIVTSDAVLEARLSKTNIGEAAPAGFNRFVNSADLIEFRLRPAFKNVNFNAAPKRVKVVSDFQERRVGEFEEQIRAYAASVLGWKAGEWTLTVNNAASAWKSGRGPVEIEVSGINNPFAKGNMNLLITARQGNRVNRIPVSCNIRVNTAVLVAKRAISRDEELTGENTMLAVMDITNFVHNPMRQIPESGTMMTMRTVNSGAILHDKLMKTVPVVSRGDQVRISFNGERVRISVLGVARESGVNGDKIWVENLQTRKLVRASVSGRGSVIVHQEGDRI
ncbi:MAG: flagellar basal body P-ring formation chaperone FlgA [Chitinispirillia bacterium]|nr:flagellar basal body P-ring formation chaperone FlgA [Chitinispirillia bacterium]